MRFFFFVSAYLLLLCSIFLRMNTIALHDKHFELEFSESEILKAVENIAEKINTDYSGKDPLFVAVLNGSFMFASDLMKLISVPCAITFTKMASYEGTASSGKVNELIGLNTDLKGRNVIIVEDIVDTGNTLQKLHQLMFDKGAKSVTVASLLYKPDAYKYELPVDYVGISIGNDFIVGYGLDYRELGRNLKDIYKVVD